MPEKTKKGREAESEPTGSLVESNWSEDQKSRPYYYDDACGYEKYTPDAEEEEDEDDEDDAEDDPA